MENKTVEITTKESNYYTEIKKPDKEFVLNMVAKALYYQLRQDLDNGVFMINENDEIVPGPNFNATSN